MAVKRPVIERQEGWKRGEIKAVESQALSLDSLTRCENWEKDLSGDLISSPGYAPEFTVGLHRQIADMEDAEDARWAGALVDDLVNFQYGFQSRQHEHGGAGALNSTFTRPLSFLGDVFNTTTDEINFRLRASDVSELVDVEIRFREGGGDYFTTTLTVTAANGVWQLFQVLQSAFTISGTPEWDQIIDMHIISTAAVGDAGGVVNLAFDDFFILRPGDAVGEPIWDVFGFERVSTPERYLMVSSGSEIWSYLGTVKTKRQSSLDAGRFINMIVANDMVISANGSDNIKRWDAGDSTFRDLGVPVPPNTIVGADNVGAGVVEAGTYFFVTVFDMGSHGEGNSIFPATKFVVVAAPNHRIDYTVIPIGPPGTIRRLVYRTQKGAGASGALRLDVIINDNTTTTGQSNVADANLGATLVQNASQPLVGSMLVHANRTLFLAGVPGSESSVFHSDITRAANRTIEQWDPTDEFRLNPDDGDRITGMIYFQRHIYIFKRRSIWILNPIDLGAPLQISTTYGSIGHRCLVDGGTVLYAWSDEHGPLEIRGQTVTPIGILESNLEREGPRVGDINGNVTETAASVLGSIITTQNDFEDGTLSDTSATEIPGSLTLTRATIPGTTQNVNIAALSGASGTGFTNSVGGLASVVDLNKARDGIINIDNATRYDLFSVGAQDTFSGNYTITLAKATNISKIKITMFQRTVVGDFIEVPATVDVQYQTTGGSFVTVGSFLVTDNTALGTDTDQFLQEINFTPVTTQSVRLIFTWFPEIVGSILLFINEFEVFETGFFPAGSWRSGSIDLGQTPSAWGKFNANFVLPPTGTLQFFMKSAATSGGLSVANFEPVTPGIGPDELVIPLNQFIEWQATLASSATDETPQINDISILFTSAAANFVRPRFESAGVLFDRRYWLSAVSRDDSNPTLVWKYQQLEKSWSRHPGFNMSAWTRLSESFFSGSAVDGRVFRNVIDINGNLIRNFSGEKILCIAETKDSAPTGQDHSSTVLDFAIVCRNEARNKKNLIRNFSFEDWDTNKSDPIAGGPDFFTPSAWGSEGNFRFGQGLLREDDPRNVVDRSFSLMLDWSSPSTAALVNNQRIGGGVPTFVSNTTDLLAFHDVSLLPDSDYILTYYDKKDFGAAMNIFRIQDFRSDGNHEFLRQDGTWGALVEEFLGDNTVIEETMRRRTFAFKTNSSDPNHVFYRVQFGYLITTNGVPGVTWLDDVTLYEAPLSTPRYVYVLPILDGKDDVPERQVNITGDNDGILDVGVIREQFRIDKARVKNVRFRFRHHEDEAQAKIMGLYVKTAAEEWAP